MLTPHEETYGQVKIAKQGEEEIYTVESIFDSYKVMTGDTVLCDIGDNKNKCRIIKIMKRNNKPIIGVLCLSSNVILGITRRNVPQKKFSPLDRKIHPFIVSTKRPRQSTDVYAIINFKEWKDTKYPVGLLERIIGDIGDYKSEIEYLKYRNDIRWKRYRKIYVEEYIQNDPYKEDRVDYTELDTVSIDPTGCEDIDDALHIREINREVEVGIHIADVASYITEDSYIDNEIKKRGESVYFMEEQINMLPNRFATEICSLLEGEKRRTSTVLVRINKDTGEILDKQFSKGIIINKRTISYEEAEKEKYISGTIKNLYEIGKLLNKDDKYDCHKMVEVFMILANTCVAEKLVERDKYNSILRSHRETEDRIRVSSEGEDMDKAIRHANILKMESAEYTMGDNNYGHSALNRQNYTHFTSPIRRYVDILVHRLLYTDYKVDRGIVKRLNEMHRNIKRAEREERRMNIIYKIYKEEESVLETYGYVIGKNGDQYISIYIPEIKIEALCKLYSNKVKDIINRIKCEYEILERVEIKVVISLKAPRLKDKILIQIL